MAELTAEELVAKAIAPVKKEFLRPPPSRTNQNETAVPDADANANAKSTVVSKEKKSKRQMKRERREKSVQHICPEIAKREDVNSCRYGDKCRFSHDLEAFKAQKPPDLEGKCPFMDGDGPCPYGLACRFYGTHEDSAAVAGNGENVQKKCFEINGLKKDVQKLLWKNKMKFPKADAKLKSLGLMGPGNSRVKRRDDEGADQTLGNGSHVTDENGCDEAVNDLSDKSKCSSEMPIEDNAADGMTSDETRPLKKAKSAEEKCCHNEEANELSVPENHAKNSSEPELQQCSSEVPIEDNAGNGITTDETRPLKKVKSVEENCCAGEEANELSVLEKGGGNSSRAELEVVPDGVLTETDASLKTHPREKKLVDFRGKLYLAPLTTVGNLPFRRVCKVLGADVTCGEMAMCTNLLQGQASEWALLRRHSSEDLFGVQICGAYPDTVSRTVELIDQECTVDFIDINMGCPIDIVVNKGAGSSLLTKPMRMKNVIEAASGTVDRPITVKARTGFFEGKNRIDSLIADIGNWGANAVTVHGRTRQQRYSKLADWDYIYQCARKAPESLQVLGNGDIFSYTDWNNHKSDCPELSSYMIARGALIKPWIFTEIKEQRHWDIRSGERLDILKDYVHFGLEHWGSDAKGVETTRNFLLEWLSYTCRYIPVGLLDVIPQRINWRPPSYYGRDELETLMASDSAADWIRISEMLLGKVPDGFTFVPKHKSNAYDRAENG